MTDNIRWGLDNPHPFSQMKTELIWEGKYDEYGNRRAVDIAGCRKAASKEQEKWIYLYVTEGNFEELSDNRLKTLLRMCKPSLRRLITEVIHPQLSLPFGEPEPEEDTGVSVFLSDTEFRQLPTRYQKAIAQAVTLLYFSKKERGRVFCAGAWTMRAICLLFLFCRQPHQRPVETACNLIDV